MYGVGDVDDVYGVGDVDDVYGVGDVDDVYGVGDVDDIYGVGGRLENVNCNEPSLYIFKLFVTASNAISLICGLLGSDCSLSE